MRRHEACIERNRISKYKSCLQPGLVFRSVPHPKLVYVDLWRMSLNVTLLGSAPRLLLEELPAFTATSSVRLSEDGREAIRVEKPDCPLHWMHRILEIWTWTERRFLLWCMSQPDSKHTVIMQKKANIKHVASNLEKTWEDKMLDFSMMVFTFYSDSYWII